MERRLDLEKITDKELYKIEGGTNTVGLSAIIVGAVTAIVAFISGIIDGYTNPQRCNQ